MNDKKFMIEWYEVVIESCGCCSHLERHEEFFNTLEEAKERFSELENEPM